MNIKQLITKNQKKMVDTRNEISKLDVKINNLEMEIKGIQREADIKIKAKKCEMLNLFYDKEELIKELADVKQKIKDLEDQM